MDKISAIKELDAIPGNPDLLELVDGKWLEISGFKATGVHRNAITPDVIHKFNNGTVEVESDMTEQQA